MKFAKKIFIYIFLSTALIIFGMSIISVYWTTQHHVQEVVSLQKELTVLAALKSEDYILRNDRIELHQFYRSILKVNPYIKYIFVEKQGEVLTHTFSKGVPKGLLNLGPVAAPSEVDITPVENNQGNVILHLRTGIGAPVHAILHFGVSKNKIRAAVTPLRNLMMISGGILLLIIPFGLASFISRLVSRPLNTLSNGVKQIGKGNLNYRLEISTGDEIEQLSDDINSMAGNIEKLRNGLEGEIVERMQAESDLARQTELLNNILHNVPHDIFWKNERSVYLGCNKTFAETSGLTHPNDIVGKTDYDLPWKKQEIESFRKSDAEVMDKGLPVYDIEEKLTQANGQEKTIITSKVPLKDKDGNVFGLLGINYDITERKHLEETAKQTQKMEAIGTLAGGIAHDFNNILGGIIGYSELALDAVKTDSDAYNFLNQVLKAGTRAKDLVRQILSFSRKGQNERKPLDLSHIVKEEAKLLRSTLPTTIEIHQNINNDLGMVNADLTQMHQVVMNLCTNAAHAMREHGGRLEISLSPVILARESIRKYHDILPGPYVELKISDTGTGIDSKIIHRIFEPFFTTKEKENGTGMGLAVVHGIVKEHSGDIIVESSPDKGTTFTVLLPQVLSENEEKEKTSLSVPLGNERVLLIDDEKMLLDFGEKTLTSLGYKVKTMNSSIEALEVFQKSPDAFDIIITDHTMPHMTGYNLAKHILEIKPDAKIILCTGYSDNITPEKIERAGIMALLYKPIRKMEIAKTVREVLFHKESRRGNTISRAKAPDQDDISTA